MSGASPSGRGLRRDAPILLPAALLLFAMLAAVTLLSYRSAVTRFTEEREQATLKQAIALADAARFLAREDWVVLVRGLPPGVALGVYDERGAAQISQGFDGPDARALAVPRASQVAAPRVDGLGRRAARAAPRPGMAPEPDRDRVRAYVPFAHAGQRFLLRLETREPTLLAQQRSLRILTPVVFGLSFAVALLTLFFLRALVRPYEALLERARAAAPASATGAGTAKGSDDEVEFLLQTFDRALLALRGANGRPAAALDDLAAVERTLGPQLESGLLMFDREGRLLAANPAAVDLLGGTSLTPESSVGDPVPITHRQTASVALAAHPELAGVVAAAIADRRSIPRASVAIVRAGRRVELGLTLQALRPAARTSEEVGARAADEDPGPGFLVLFADVTDLTRRESEERFAASLAQLGELSAGVAHELRNSLATVQGYLALAARRALPDAAREEIAEARRETEALTRTVDDFLTFARPGSGVLEPIDLAALLAGATRDPALADVAIELVLPEAPLPAIAGDARLLQRALRNLLLNAVQATLARAAQGGPGTTPEPVRVGLQKEDRESLPGDPPAGVSARAQITIDDHGSGVAPEVADRLFEPFVSGRPGGAGLGLALAHRIVVLHGGTLRLTPRQPHGVRAEICLSFGDIATKGNQGDHPQSATGPGTRRN